MDTGSTSRWALYWRNKCGRSLEQVREELNPLFKRIAMPRLRKELKMARRFKTIELNIRYQIYEDELKILEKYGYDFERNAEQESMKQAKNVAAELKMIEEMRENND